MPKLSELTSGQQAQLRAAVDAAGGDPSARRALKRRLVEAADRGSRQYRFPDALPIIPAQGQWVAATLVYNGECRAVGSAVYMVSGFTTSSAAQGTTGSVAPSGRGNAITDGEVVWTYVGYLAPVGYANSQALYADQLVYNAGKVYRVTVPGATATSGAGPTHLAGTATDGAVTFAYVGEQTKPLVALNTAVGAGLSLNTGTPKSGIPWDSPAATVLGGTMVQNAANARGGIASRSIDGGAYTEANSEGGGSIFTVTDAPSLDFTFTGGGSTIAQQGLTVWCDGEFVAFVTTSTNTQKWLNLNFAGLPTSRRVRTLRFMIPFSIKFAGFAATPADTFRPYTPADTLRAVHLGDSFVGGAAGIIYPLLYATKLGLSLGIDDYRVSGLGGTGVLQPNGSSVNYGSRFSQDMIAQSPDVAIIQSTGNDANGVNAGNFTTDQVRDALAALIQRVKVELPNAQPLTISVWNNRGVLATPHSTINANAIAAADAAQVPVIDWSSYLTDGGYVGHVVGSGNSGVYTSENTHPTYLGHDFRARMLLPATLAVWQGMAV